MTKTVVTATLIVLGLAPAPLQPQPDPSTHALVGARVVGIAGGEVLYADSVPELLASAQETGSLAYFERADEELGVFDDLERPGEVDLGAEVDGDACPPERPPEAHRPLEQAAPVNGARLHDHAPVDPPTAASAR